jgi:hypothetical protein
MYIRQKHQWDIIPIISSQILPGYLKCKIDSSSIDSRGETHDGRVYLWMSIYFLQYFQTIN